MRNAFKRFLASVIAGGMLLSSMPAFAYNAEPSGLTGNMDGLRMAKTVAEEGMVLLENNGALPLSKGETIAVFGINQIDFIYGGGGSGNFSSDNERVDYISLYDALKDREEKGDIILYNDLISSYETYYNNYWAQDGRTYAYGTRQGAIIKYWGEMAITQSDAVNAAKEAETAIITIGRPAGEDGDRSNSEGDFKLNTVEKNMIQYVENAGFDKVIVILNVTGVIESDWLKNEAIDAVLYVSLPGMMGGEAMADVLLGDGYPSGKLVDTWAGSYTDYPSSSNFGNSSYTNYKEDIFVGYRYFETIPGAYEKVNYPFGYGLSYADFEITDKNVSITGEGRDRTVTVTARVTNNGEYPGKEVVQVYAGSPETNLTQPKKELAGFCKTKELKSGESEVVTISFPFDDLASYDDTGKTAYEAAYVLESGEYTFYVGNCVRCEETYSYNLDETELAEQLEHHLVPDTTKLSERLLSDGTYEKIEQKENAPVSDDPNEDVDARYKAIYTAEDVTEVEGNAFISFYEVAQAFLDEDGETAEDTRLLEAFVARLTDEEAVKLTGCTTPESGKGHRTGLAGLDVYDVPIVGSSNGPAGIQYNGSSHTWETTSTFYPCATMQACTWNEELIEQLGAAIADEARYFGMSLWQAPGMNIHRDPLCGRNFEYFSEDPFVTGKIGAAITRGVQSRKFASQLKHFAFNNQEKGRWGNDSRISERAIREIYLKGFEIAIKESDPWSVMSSYNRINGTQTSGSYQLLTEILRNEWGYEGFVMTDFRTQNVTHAREIDAGNDVKAPADSPNPQNVLTAMESWLPRWKVNRSAERVLRFVLKTEDAAKLLEEEYEYNITLSVDNDKIQVGSKITLTDSVTWKEFLDSIVGYYGQTYTLIGVDGKVITDENTVLQLGMRIKVVAEDGVTEKIFDISGDSLALNKNVKASYEESGTYAASKAVDGNLSTRWSGFSANYVWNDWIEVDLGEEYHVTRVDVSCYKGDERIYCYELYTADGNAESYWDDKRKDRDFISQGYNLAVKSQTDYNTLQSDTMDEYARFIALKMTDGVGALGPTIYELEVFGWKLTSDEYVIDEENKTISVWVGDTTSDAVSKLKLSGLATLEFAGGNDTWVNEGEKFVVTDQNGVQTEYTVKEVYKSITDLDALGDTIVDNTDNLIYAEGEYDAGEINKLVRSLYNASLKFTDNDGDGKINYGDSVEVTAEDNVTKAVFKIVTGKKENQTFTASATRIENGTYDANKIADGDLSTRWSAYGKNPPQAVCISLGEEKNITRVSSYWYGEGRESTYNIYITDAPTVVDGVFTAPKDGYSKTNLKSYGSNSDGMGYLETIDLTDASGKYLTIYCTANSSNVASLWEVEVYTESPYRLSYEINSDTVTLRAKGGKCYAGIYDEEGILLRVYTVEGERTVPFDERMCGIKGFFWENLDLIKPLTEAVEAY